jgi:hypothetical protein
VTTPPTTSPAIVVPGPAEVALGGGFWGEWRHRHVTTALDHQWQMLEATGSLQAFRLVAGLEKGFRACATGIPFSDSDVYKWVDAASRALAGEHPPELPVRLDEAVRAIRLAQDPDGYLNTWIQTFFPRGRFRELVLEHELYCMGHLIEAAVSHHESTGSDELLDVARRAADLLVQELRDAPPHVVDGHQEVELALVRLHRATDEDAYLDLARRFIDRRGTAPGNGRRYAAGFARLISRELRRMRAQRRYAKHHPTWESPILRGDDHFSPTRAQVLRFLRDGASGVYFQTDRPARELVEPSGHAVRFGYQQVAMAMLARELGDDSLGRATTDAWKRMVEAHTFASGGVGAQPIVEAFDEPYRLDPDVAYLETCAAIAGVLWGRELGLLTGDAGADDLLEWQLLNAVDVGMAADGRHFTYDNPLRVPPGHDRKEWFAVPCCPSNLSRTWASLGTLQFSRRDDELRIHQLFSATATFGGATVEVDGDLPWSGRVAVRVAPDGDPAVAPRTLAVRLPSWVGDVTVSVDGRPAPELVPPRPDAPPSASGLAPGSARWLTLELTEGATSVDLDLEMPIRLLRQDRRVPEVGGRVAVARGPLLFCLEGIDHPGLDHLVLSDLELDAASLETIPADDLPAGAVALHGHATDGRPLRFVPYFLWGNRGAQGMSAFVRSP